MPSRKHKLRIGDFEKYRIVADAQINRQGNLIVFSVGAPTHLPGKSAPSRLWLVETQNGTPRPITHSPHADAHPRWSPDGTSIAFVSDRAQDNTFQIYLLGLNGGEAFQLTDVPGLHTPYRDLPIFKWSPDGTRIAFLTKDAEDAEIRERRAQGFDEIEFEQRPRYSRVWVLDVKSRDVYCATKGEQQVWEFDWSPDGNEFALVCSEFPYEWSWYEPWLARVPTKGATPRRIYSRPKRQVAAPFWSPDGEQIAFLSSLWSDRGITSGDLYVIDAEGKHARTLSEGYPGSLSWAQWIDEQKLIAIGYEQGEAALAVFSPDGQHETIWRGTGAFQESYAPKFTRAQDGAIAVVRSAPHEPREVWVMQANAPTAQPSAPPQAALDSISVPLEAAVALVWEQLTQLNAPLLDIAVGEQEEVRWKSTDGKTIQGILVKPVGYKEGKRVPLIVHPHGGPTGISANEYFSLHRWVYHLTTRGYAVFMPNYRGSTGWGIEFAEANLGDMGGKDFEDIMTGVDALIKRGFADSKRLGIGGWSYGGFMTGWATTQTNRFKAAVAGAAILHLVSFHGTSYLCVWDEIHYDAKAHDPEGAFQKFSPMNFVARVKTPTLILHGEKDGDVPVEQGYEWFRALRDHGVETEMVVYPREPHAVTETSHVRDMLDRVCEWFELYLR